MEHKEYQLTEENISNIAREAKAYFVKKKTTDRNALKLSLLVEDVLLEYKNRFGRD